ncbi:hypothetical protein FD951_12265 [Pseudomonas chlororaphis subsp. aurantiaca]|uniref:DUF6429 family protein n=1 Tax=Pseudomonas chlororaphis TaxID=587753 RepID=UPI0009B8D00D|nr:hypothetical protein FD951_12265 [Pseudomonas chlororaphis subsp. aurantiaca]
MRQCQQHRWHQRQSQAALIEEAVLALLAAFSFDDGNAWKGYDFETMNRQIADRLFGVRTQTNRLRIK